MRLSKFKQLSCQHKT